MKRITWSISPASTSSRRPPYDAGVYRPGTFALDEHRFAADSPVLEELREVWERNILQAVAELPDVELGELTDETSAEAATR